MLLGANSYAGTKKVVGGGLKGQLKYSAMMFSLAKFSVVLTISVGSAGPGVLGNYAALLGRAMGVPRGPLSSMSCRCLRREFNLARAITF